MPYKYNPFSGQLDYAIGPGSSTATTDFDTDSGSAVPTAAGVITIAGGTGLNTAGAGNTVTINLDDPVIVDNGGTGRTTLTDGSILVGDGTNPVELVGPLTDGQLLIGDTAGVSPVASTLTASTGINISNGAGSITISADAAVATSYQTDSGTALPAANVLDIAGGTGIDTSGSGNTVTVTLSTPVDVTDGGTGATTLTDHGFLFGSGTSAITPSAAPTNGQLPIGSTGVDPVLAELTAPAAGITITGGAGSITFALADDLAALEALSGTGLVARTGAATYSERTVTGTSNQIAVADGDGVSGDPTLSLTSDIYVDGISFDSGSNVLSNYATGTFIPDFTTSGVAVDTITFSSALGRYIRIGALVWVQIELVTSAYTVGSGTGTVRIGNLPFTANNNSINFANGACHFDNLNLAATTVNVSPGVVANTTYFQLLEGQDNGGGASVGVGGWNSNTNLWASITYEI